MVLLVTMCMLNKVWSVPWNKIAKAVIIIILLICFAYFVHEVFVKYVAKETNFSQTTKKKDSFDCPTTTMCFNPPLKKSARELYNLSQTVYYNFGFNQMEFIRNGSVLNQNSTYSLHQLFNESSYWLGKDFTLEFIIWNFGSFKLQEGVNLVSGTNKDHAIIQVNMIHSYTAGLCYQITPKSKLNVGVYHFFSLSLADSLNEKDKPNNVELTITSENNLYGIVKSVWVEGDTFDITVGLDKPTEAAINLKPVQYNLYQPTSNCSTESHYKCVGLRLQEKEQYKNCTKFCIPVIFQTLVNLVSNKSLQICESVEENFCMVQSMWNDVMDKASKECPKNCHISEYIGKVKYYQPNYPNSIAEWSYVIPLTDMMVYDEYLIYDHVGMIGSIGGSLGMFIGLSFLDFFFYLIELIQKKLK